MQRKEIVYSYDVNCNIVEAENHLQTWESLNLTHNQKLYRLIFSYTVLPQLMLHIKKLKQSADESDVITLWRMTRREKTKKKEEKDHVNNS